MSRSRRTSSIFPIAALTILGLLVDFALAYIVNNEFGPASNDPEIAIPEWDGVLQGTDAFPHVGLPSYDTVEDWTGPYHEGQEISYADTAEDESQKLEDIPLSEPTIISPGDYITLH